MIFDFLKNDWEIVWADAIVWSAGWDKSRYEIRFSPSRNKYKLVVGGDDPKFSPMYKMAVEKLKEYNSKRNI